MTTTANTADQEALRVANRYAGLIEKAETLRARAGACLDAAAMYRRDARASQESADNHRMSARTIPDVNVSHRHAVAARDAEAEAAREILAAHYYEAQSEQYQADRIPLGLEQAPPAQTGPATDKGRTHPPRAADPFGYDEMAAAVASGARDHTPLHGGLHAVAVDLVTFQDGSRYVVKQVHVFDRDGVVRSYAAECETLIARAGWHLGAPVPRVLRTGPGELVIDYLAGATAAEVLEGMTPNERYDWYDTMAATAHGQRLGLLYLLTQYLDRNDMNLIVQNGQVYGIDFEDAFNFAADNDPATPPGSLSSGITGAYQQYNEDEGQYEWSPNPLTSTDVEWVRQRLDDMRPEFEAAGHGRSWQFMCDRFAVIAQHATGTTNVLAPPIGGGTTYRDGKQQIAKPPY